MIKSIKFFYIFFFDSNEMIQMRYQKIIDILFHDNKSL